MESNAPLEDMIMAASRLTGQREIDHMQVGASHSAFLNTLLTTGELHPNA
jgi:hypothetical protein